MKKILIITSSNDLTVDYLIGKYRSETFYRLNVDLFHEYKIVVTNSNITIESVSWATTFLDLNSIYYRKPTLPDYRNTMSSEYLPFINSEIFGFIEGIIESFRGTCITKPSILRVANNKIVQCLKAKEIGLNLPEAWITNSVQAISFEQALIVKPISNGEIVNGMEKIFVQTNMVDSKHGTENLKYCPAYFQKFIDKDFDLRVTVVGQNIFPVKINSTDKVDWRHPGAKLSYEKFEISHSVREMCLKLLRDFGLRFGCIDFVSQRGELYFLEVNANGQWLWLEEELGIDISGSILSELSC